MIIPAVLVTDLPVVSVEQMVEVDRIMIEEIGIALLQMMENAGRNIAELARSLLGGSLAGRRVAVLVGPGHNGGGGLVAARHMSNGGAAVEVILGTDASRLKRTTALQLQILHKMQIPMHPSAALRPDAYALLIDALLGYSAKGAPRGEIATLITGAGQTGTAVLALDLPSGLDPEAGTVMNPHITARATLTLAAPKAGLITPEARAVVGDLYVGDISVPASVYKRLGLREPGAIFGGGPIVHIAQEELSRP